MEWMTTDEAARYLRVSRRTIQNWMARGLLKHSTVGQVVRIKREWCDEAMQQSSEQDGKSASE